MKIVRAEWKSTRDRCLERGIIEPSDPVQPFTRPFMHRDAVTRTRAHYVKHGLLKPRHVPIPVAKAFEPVGVH